MWLKVVVVVVVVQGLAKSGGGLEWVGWCVAPGTYDSIFSLMYLHAK